MAEMTNTAATSTTVVDNEDELETNERLILRLKLRKPESKKKVQWQSGTVDNENMNKKKSKCCCIYHKPHEFDVSSSESDDECENCFGHTEVKKKRVKSEDKEKPLDGGSTDNDKPNENGEGPSENPDPDITPQSGEKN